jgi:hypothetical protein
MHRPWFKLRSLLAPALIALGAFAVACGGAAEKPIIDKYFKASMYGDNMTLANIATVSFSPRTEGTVTRFDVVSVAPEQRQTLRARELAKEAETAAAANNDFSKKMKDYQDANLDTINRILKAERENAKLRGRDLEVQAEWTKFREETGHYQKRVSDTRKALSTERGIAELSVSEPQQLVDVTQYDGELVSKDVTIDAKVQMPEGAGVVDRRLVVTIQRAELRKDGETKTGRWIVTNVRDAAGSPTTEAAF